MSLSNIRRIGVIGAGSMGNQIAEILVRVGGYGVNIFDINTELVNKGIASIDTRLEKFFVAKGKMTADEKSKLMGEIRGTDRIEEAASDVDYIIEAVLENLTLKKEIFKKLDESARAGVVLVSNTSYLNITEMASATKRPELVAGMHFFNPVAVMKLVEVVRGTLTSDLTVELVRDLSLKLGKEPVICRDTSYGFLANRAYRGLSNECVQMVWERVASPADIDKALKLGYNLPLGPFEVADMTGSWGLRATSEQDAIRELGSEKGKLHPLVRMMIRAGYTGGQGKKGIYAFWDDVLSRW